MYLVKSSTQRYRDTLPLFVAPVLSASSTFLIPPPGQPVKVKKAMSSGLYLPISSGAWNFQSKTEL